MTLQSSPEQTKVVTKPIVEEENSVSHGELAEACQICLEELPEADMDLPLICPTFTCHFTFCSDCLRRMIRSAAEGYSEASDGSKQLKTSVACPQCRSSYKVHNTDGPTIVPGAMLLLRQCYAARHLLETNDDSLLSSTELIQKYQLVNDGNGFQDVQAAYKTVQMYQEFHNLEPKIHDKMPSDLSPYKVLENRQCSSASNSSNGKGEQQEILPDPSLFRGFHDFLSRDEQLHLTKLFVSGDAQKVAQGALLLESLSKAPSPPSLSRRTIDFAQIQKFQKQHPLPAHMPLCVTIPVSDLLKFKFAAQDSLILQRVVGVAGRRGLRRGDQVTHVQGESVSCLEDISVYNDSNNNSSTTEVAVVVNVLPETVSKLKERSGTVRKALRQFL